MSPQDKAQIFYYISTAFWFLFSSMICMAVYSLPKKGIFFLIKLLFWPQKLFLKAIYKTLKFLIKTLLIKPVHFLYRKLVPRKAPHINYTLEEIDKLGGKDGKWFEEYVATLYRSLGHTAYTTTELRQNGELPDLIMKQSGVGEQGVDVVVKTNMNTGGKKLLIQCKYYSQNVGNEAVQQIFTALNMYQGDLAVVITNRDFTKPARNLAKVNGVLLIGRSELPKLIKNAVEHSSKKVA